MGDQLARALREAWYEEWSKTGNEREAWDKVADKAREYGAVILQVSDPDADTEPPPPPDSSPGVI